MNIKATIMDGDAIKRSLRRIAHEIVEKNDGLQDIVLIGILTRGVTLAQFLQTQLEQNEKVQVPLGLLDIVKYRDDHRKNKDRDRTSIDFSIEGKKVLLVDDVLYTGRTLRAAIEAIFDLGRPSMIQVAVLVDRGHRELPIRADFVGKNIPTSQKEKVVVNLQRNDGLSQVIICE